MIYSEKEHRKWFYQAISMENNPSSKDREAHTTTRKQGSDSIRLEHGGKQPALTLNRNLNLLRTKSSILSSLRWLRRKRTLLPSGVKLEKRTFPDKIQIHPMKQIQNTVPQSQHHARACRPPASQIRRPVRRSGAKSRRASKATRRDEASAEAGGARGRQKSARVRAVEAEQESIPYLTLRARTEA